MITDEMLERLLTESAESYEIPAGGSAAVRDALTSSAAAVDRPRSFWSRAPLGAAAALVLALVAGVIGLSTLDATTRFDSNLSAPISDVDPGRGQSGEEGGRDTVAVEPVAPGTGGGGGGTAATSGGALTTDASGGTAGSGAAPAPQPATAGGQPAGGSRAVIGGADAAKVVKTGSVDLAVDDGQVSPTLTRVTALAAANRGYVAKSSSDENDDDPSGTVVVRVPAGTFEKVVEDVRRLGDVRSSTTTGQDVTAQYVDQSARIRALRAQREVYLRLLAEARTIGETLSVQQRIDAVQVQLEQVECQRRMLDEQTAYGTLQVSVSEQGSAVAATPERRSGLSKAFDDAVDGFTSGVTWLIAHSGRALLWVLCLGVLLVATRVGYRSVRRRLV